MRVGHVAVSLADTMDHHADQECFSVALAALDQRRPLELDAGTLHGAGHVGQDARSIVVVGEQQRHVAFERADIAGPASGLERNIAVEQHAAGVHRQ